MNATPPSRTTLIGVGIFFVGLALVCVWPRGGAITVALGLLVFFCDGTGGEFVRLLGGARKEWLTFTRHIRVRKFLLRRRVREITRPTATMGLAWQAFILMVVLAVLSTAAGVTPDGERAALDTLTRLGVAIALTDLLVMGVRALRWPWARSAGKGFKTLFATLVTALAIAIARRLVFDLAGEDPAKFPGALGVISLLCLPLAWAAVVAVVAAFAVPPAMIWALLRAGRDGHSLIANCARGARLVLIGCAVVCTFGALSPPDIKSHLWLHQAGIGILVGMDFWAQPACGGPRLLSARVGDNRYLLPPAGSGPFAFRPLICPVPH